MVVFCCDNGLCSWKITTAPKKSLVPVSKVTSQKALGVGALVNAVWHWMQGPLAEDNHSGGSCVVAKECSIRGHAIRRYSVFYVHATRPVHTVRFGKESVYKGTFSVSGYLTLRVLTIRNTPHLHPHTFITMG